MEDRGSKVSTLSHENHSCFGNQDDDDTTDLLLDDGDMDLCLSDVDTAWQDRMKAALSAALASRTLTPLLKEELHCKIQLRRLQSGKEEMTPDFSVNPAVMSMEEVMKRNRKMEQNRLSAQKSRDRRKSLEKTVQARLERLEKDNTLLLGQAERLRHASRLARQWLLQHCSCPENCIASLSTSVSAAGPSSGAESSPRPVVSRHKSDSSACSESPHSLSTTPYRRLHSDPSPVTAFCGRRDIPGSSLSATSSRHQKSSSSSSSVTSPTSSSDYSWSSSASSRHSSVDSSAGLSRFPSSSDDLAPSISHQHNVFECAAESLVRDSAN